MRKSYLILLILLCCCFAVSFAGADQTVPFAPLSNVTGNYTFTQGTDFLKVNTNFPISSQDVVYPDWLFALMLIFIVITVYFALVFISREPEPWVSVIACGVLVFGFGLSAAEMAALVGYSTVFQQVVPGTPNTIYVNQVIVYTMGTWVGLACWGIAIGGGFILMVAGILLQQKQARRIANAVQAEKIQAEEIDFRTRESRRGR